MSECLSVVGGAVLVAVIMLALRFAPAVLVLCWARWHLWRADRATLRSERDRHLDRAIELAKRSKELVD